MSHQHNSYDIRRYLKNAGIGSQKILAAMSDTPRRAFVAESLAQLASKFGVVPIEAGQYIQGSLASAQLLEAARIDQDMALNILVVGSGSLYSCALIAKLGHTITAIERQPKLVESGLRKIRNLGLRCIDLHLNNGLNGWANSAPYDRVILFGACENIRPILYAQLKPNGYVIMPADVDGKAAILRSGKSTPTTVLPLNETFIELEDSQVLHKSRAIGSN